MKKLLCALLSVLLIFTSIVVPVGAVEEEETGIFEYSLNENGTITIYEYNGTDENVVIPSEIDGHVVSRIGHGTFDSQDKVKTVIIPATVNSVFERAFNEVATLERVEFKNDGKRNLILGEEVFYNCTALAEIVLPDERIYSIDEDTFFNTAFTNNESNWENGALYLGNILLSIDATKLQDRFEVKDGTTVIADNIFVVDNEQTGESEVLEIEAVVPDSIVVIGSRNWIDVKNINEKLERIGTFGDVSGYVFMYDVISKYKEYTAQVEATGYVKPEDLHMEYVENGWLMSAIPMSLLTEGLVTDEMYIVPEGIRRIPDNYNTFIIDVPGVLCSMNYCNNVILPESFEVLPADNPMCSNMYNVLSGVCSTVTFLNKNTEIFDSDDTITTWVHTICGYSGSTAEAYAKKYNRTFVDITNCTHEVTAVRGAIAPACGRTGYSGDTYCAYCAEFLSAGEILENHGDYHYEGGNECEDSYIVYECELCGYKGKVVDKKGLGHLDEDFDGNCDYCGDFSDRARACSCKACKYHKGELNFIQELFTSIQLFFWKLFRIKEVCDCGITHWNR